MKKQTKTSFFLFFCIFSFFLIVTCVSKKQIAIPGLAPVTFQSNEEELRIEEMHSRVFRQLGSYKGSEACYACHQKEYREISNSYHVHQGRITKDGKIAYDPSKAVDTGMYTRWYPLSNLDRTAEPEKHWRQMEAIFCAQCHPGGGVLKPYGMDVDCLICHQKSGYKGGQGLGRSPAGIDKHGKMVLSNGARLSSLMMAGAKVGGNMKKLDLSDIAVKAMEGVELRVGKPTPDNCNFCHWRTNGKRGTRYGLFKGSPTDVHYAAGIRCQECHITKNHQIGKGKILDAIGTPELRGTMKTCMECHGDEPHEGTNKDALNEHLHRITCEVCHIPKTYPGAKQINWLPGMDMEKMMKQYQWMMPIAKLFGMATPEKMNQQINDMVDCYKIMKKAGFKPVYAWYNPDVLCTEIPHPTGSREDNNSRITPFSVVETILFDDGTTTEVLDDPHGYLNGHPVPKAFVARAGGKGKKDTTLKQLHQWQNGRYGSAIIRKSPMYFQQFHSIAPAKDALTCKDCHIKAGGRLDFKSLGYSPEEIEDLTEQ